MSESAAIAASEPDAPESGVPIRVNGERQDLAWRVRPIIEAFVARLPAVRAAYLRADGKDFIFAGDGFSVEMSEAAADLSVALQRAFEATFNESIEGGYQPFRDGEIQGYETIFVRS
jgi:hypothetical protein